jgi:RHS repeat-associated protein
MSHRATSRAGLAIAIAACALSVMRLLPIASASQPAAPPSSPANGSGATTTLLADGRWLIVGGDGTNGPRATATVVRPTDGLATALASGMVQPRSGHSATLLADGTVLIAGGRSLNGQLATAAELFEPTTNTFIPITISGAQARTGQSATLLSDGRVLVAGGTGVDGGLLAGAEIWDVGQNNAIAISGLQHPRATAHADLLPDGRVLITGGSAADGSAIKDSEAFDPVAQRFATVPPPDVDASLPFVTMSAPLNGAVDIAFDVRVALRFSQLMRVESVTAQTLNMTGPNGAVDLTIVVAEGGRLAFLSPRTSLAPSSTYAITLNGAVDWRGVPIAPMRVTFTTVDTKSVSSAPDQEEWTPGALTGPQGWRSNRPPSPWQSMRPLQAPPGTTAVAGQVLRLDGRPLADTKLAMEGRTTFSDRTGRFLLLLNGLASGEHTLSIDGRPASSAHNTYGFYEARIPLKAGITNRLPFTIWSPKLDVAHEISIASPTTAETVVTTSTMPGLELHLPAGTVIRDENGRAVRKLTMTPIPLDRTPFPLPDVPFTMFFTIQPGGAYIQTPGPIKGAWLVYPNRTTFKPGTKVQFFNYDPDDNGWFVYGLGTVTPTQVVADPKTRFYAFTGASFNSGQTPPTAGKTLAGPDKADPIDPSTGAFIMKKTDLYLPDVMPLALTRTYNSLDTQQRSFGTGMTHPYGLYQYTTNQFNDGDLIFEDGGRVHFVRISADGLPGLQTVFECQAGPTAFYKSRLSFDGNSWEYTLKNGSVYVIGHSTGLQLIRDRYGNTTQLAWSATNFFGDGSGNIIRITSPSGRWIELTYDTAFPVNHITQAKDNLGRTVTYTYDPNTGNLLTVTDPAHNVTTYTWDANNRMATIKDGRGILYLTNHYDANGRVDHQTLADPNASYSFAYTTDANGNVTQTDITDPRGTIERLTFNSDHYVTSDIEAVGLPKQRTTTYERQAATDLPTAVVDGLSRRTEYTYDTAGHVLTTTKLAGTADAATTTFTYEATFFQLATVTDPLHHTWTMGYDASGQLVSTSDPLSHQTTITTDILGRVTSATDPLQHVWHFGYTGADQTSVTNPLGAVSRTFMDAAGRKLSSTDPLGRVTRFVPDTLNRVMSVTDPLGGQTTFSYDPNGNLSSLTDALTHATGYTYDTSDRVATRTDPLQHAATYGYDLNGNPSHVMDRKGQATQYQYDTLGRLAVVTYADQSTITYTYDAGDRLLQVTDSANGTITRTYDGQDRLTEEATPQGTVDYTNDADGRRATMTVAEQPVVTYGYDNAHRLTSITQGTSVVAITYDDANRRSTLTYPNGIVATYGYDDANEITSLAYTVGPTTLGNLTYTYDLRGQRTAIGGSWSRTGLPEPAASATYDAANRIATWNGQGYGYDFNGNLASSGLTSYIWNGRNQLIALSGSTAASFAYDAFGRRRAKMIGGITTNLLYDNQSFVQEQTSTGTPTANLLTGIRIDESFTRADGSGTSTMLTDAAGSVVELVDVSGGLNTHYTFEPFGSTTTSGTSSSNAQQYTGRENDGTGLYYNRARYLDPSVGQFTSEDPLRLPEYPVPPFSNRVAWLRHEDDTYSAYQYANGSPTNLIDPTGLIAVCAAEAARAFGTCLGLSMAAMSPVEVAITLSCAALGPEGFLVCMAASHEAAALGLNVYSGTAAAACGFEAYDVYRKCKRCPK